MSPTVNLICLDLEGVLVPEIWIAVAEATKIEELRLTTRDVSDYNELMRHRLGILDQRRITLADIQATIARLEPLAGAKAFLDSLRSRWQVVILSDTFEQFARPIMENLERPTLFCNSLIVDSANMITDYRLRIPDGKRKAVKAFSSIGLRVAAVGDSYNDLGMIDSADRGVLFRPPDQIRNERSDLPCTEDYDELFEILEQWTRE